MNKKMFYAHVDSPRPSVNWFSLSESERIEKLNQVIEQYNPGFNVQLLIVATKMDGQVIVRILNSLTASERGTLLLDLEELIKSHLDQGLTVWGETLGDKSSLRNLRGIEVKAL